MIVVKDRENYLVTCRVLLGDLFGAPLEDAYVKLREANVRASKRMSDAAKKAKADGNEGEMIEVFLAELPGLVIGHPFHKPPKEGQNEPEIMTNQEVVDLLADRIAPLERVITQYSDEVLFTQGKKSELSSST